MIIRSNGLAEGLSAVKTVTGPTEAVYLDFNKGRLRLHVVKDKRTAQWSFNAEDPTKDDPPELDTAVAVNYESLRKACLGRRYLAFDHDKKDNVLIISEGKYKVRLPLLPYRDPPSAPKGDPLPVEVSKMIVKMFKAATVDDPFDFENGVIVHLIGDSKGLVIASADNNHGVMFESYDKVPEFSVSIPSGYANVLALAGGKGSEMSLHVEDDKLYVQGDKLITTLPVHETRIKFSGIEQMLQQSVDSANMLSVDALKLQKAVENMGAVEGDGAVIRLSFYDREMEVSSNSKNGEVRDTLPLDGKGVGDAEFDPILLRETIGKFEGSLKIGLARNQSDEYYAVVLRAYYWDGEGEKAVKYAHMTGLCAVRVDGVAAPKGH